MGAKIILVRSFWCGWGLAVAAIALLLAGCSGGSATVTSDEMESPTNGSSLGQSGSQLIADRAVPFQVVFEWHNEALGQEGFLVWRQGEGVRRWDLAKVSDGEARTGSISIQTNDGFATQGCLWGKGNSPPGHVFVGCGPGGQLDFKPIEDMLIFPTGKRLEDQTIGGRSASCYSFTHPDYSLAAFCVDKSQGIPLLITTESLVDSLFSQSMVAISVSTIQQDLVIPDYDGVVPISELQLPDLPELP
jgi:hypothetical protein